MDAFWAGLAVGFGILLVGKVEGKAGMLSPGLPSFRPGVGPGGQSGSGPYSSTPAPAPASSSGCNSCGPSCGDTPVTQPSVTQLGTPFAPAPVTIAPATPYTGESQWYAGNGPEGPGAASWGVN